MEGYVPTSRYLSEQRMSFGLSSVACGLTDLIRLLTETNPLLRPQLESIQTQIRQNLQTHFDQFDTNALIGQGPRAIVVKQMGSLLESQEKIQKAIDDNIPPKYDSVSTENYRKFIKLVKDTFCELKNFGYEEHLSYSWFTETVNGELGEAFNGPFPNVDYSLGDLHANLRTGLYSIPTYRYSSSIKEEDKPKVFVIKLEKQIFIYDWEGNNYLYLYVPIEACWVKTGTLEFNEELLKYLDFASVNEEFTKFAEGIKKDYSQELTSEVVFEEILAEVLRKDVVGNDIERAAFTEYEIPESEKDVVVLNRITVKESGLGILYRPFTEIVIRRDNIRFNLIRTERIETTMLQEQYVYTIENVLWRNKNKINYDPIKLPIRAKWQLLEWLVETIDLILPSKGIDKSGDNMHLDVKKSEEGETNV